jgi:hypothetical protein
MPKTKVSDLIKGDKIYLPLKNVQVKVVSVEESKVLVSKLTAKAGQGIMSVPFISDKFDDLINKVNLV